MSFDTDQAVAIELISFTENDGDIYRQMTASILKNLATKKAQGKYDSDKAVQAFMYLAEAGAKKYAKEFGGVWHEHFPIQIRRMAATHWRDEFETEFALGNYNELLPRKYQPKASPSTPNVRYYMIVRVNDKTGERTDMFDHLMTRKQADIIMPKLMDLSEYPDLRNVLEPRSPGSKPLLTSRSDVGVATLLKSSHKPRGKRR